MNPDLVKGSRALLAAQKEMPNLSPEDADKIVRSYTNNQYGAKEAALYMTKLRADGGDAFATGLQGFLGNFADEAVGLLPKAAGGGESGKEELRLRDDLFHADHKVLAPIVTLASGVASAAIIGGPSLVGAAGRSALAGAAYGGVAGAGAGETTGEREQGAAVGTALGGVAGGVLGSLAGRFAGSMSRAAEAVPASVERSLATIEKTPSMQRIQASLDALRKEITGLKTTFPNAPASVESLISDKTGAAASLEKSLEKATADAASKPSGDAGERMLALVNKRYADDPVMRETATSGLKKMFPDLVTEAEPIVEAAKKTSKSLPARLAGALPNFLYGGHSGLAAVGHAIYQHAMSPAADAVKIPPSLLASRIAHGTGAGAASLERLTRSLFEGN